METFLEEIEGHLKLLRVQCPVRLHVLGKRSDVWAPEHIIAETAAPLVAVVVDVREVCPESEPVDTQAIDREGEVRMGESRVVRDLEKSFAHIDTRGTHLRDIRILADTSSVLGHLRRRV
jgi:hypothetical protein